jgi:hypothetical protein
METIAYLHASRDAYRAQKLALEREIVIGVGLSVAIVVCFCLACFSGAPEEGR